MNVDLSLINLDAESASSNFDDEIAAKMRDHLRNECFLDLAGTNRVMVLLKKAYVEGVRLLHAKMTLLPEHLGVGTDAQPSAEIIEASRERATTLGKSISDALYNAQMAMLFSMANQLATHDEKIYKRSRH
jgi:hypothetical protein